MAAWCRKAATAPSISPSQGAAPEGRPAQVEKLLEGDKVFLFDELSAEHPNPVRCTYGPAPNSTFLIGQDGTIHTSRPWLGIEAMENEIRSLLGLTSP